MSARSAVARAAWIGLAGLLATAGLTRRSPSEPAAAAFELRRVAVDPHGGGDASLSPDGRRFVIASKRTGNWELWSYDLEGGTWAQLTDHPAEDFEARFSPDGQSLAFTSDRAGQKDIWLLTLPGGEPKQLTSSPDEDEYPAWMPDGRHVVYTGGPWGRRDFFLVPVAGGPPRRLSRRSGRAGACSADADGRSVVCHRYDAGSGDVVRLWLDDGEETPLTAGVAWDYKPWPAPDRSWVAFSRSEEGPSRIWMMPGEGGRARPLTDSPFDDRWPSWSANGDRLFFHRVVEQGVAVDRLDRASGRVEPLVGADERPLQASLDPAGRRLAYCAETGHGRVVRVMDLADSATRTLDLGAREACYPRWSPDGARLAFVAKEHDRWDIGVREPGGHTRLLTEGVPGLRGMDGPVDWSPDGARLVFHADTQPFEANLWTVDARSGALERLTEDAWFDEAPSFSPDGRSILFMSTRGGNWTWGLFRMALADHSLTTLAGPEWVARNHVRGDARGAVVWSEEGDGAGEVLAERTPEGVVRRRTEAGTGVRWPAFADGGRSVVYTRVTRHVEYWLVSNPAGEGSPLNEAPATASIGPRPLEGGSWDPGRHMGPVDPHHR
jgi:TolB protein